MHIAAGRLRRYSVGKLYSLIYGVLRLVGISIHYLLTLGSRQKAPSSLVILWPRLESIDETREQLWRAHYYLPDFKVVLWVNPRMGDAPLSKPDHVGEVKPLPQRHLLVRDTRTYISYLWRVLRQGGKLLIWRKPNVRGYSLLLAFLASICAPDVVDRFSDKWDGWSYIRVRTRLLEHQPDNLEYANRFIAYLDSLPRFDKCYVFGTGPSLALADDLDFSDGYRIVCNTIVKDHTLLDRLRPHFIVAGDAIYHFGYTTFAYAFRSDLVHLLQSQDILFVYPDLFDEIVRRELYLVRSKLVAVPICSSAGIRFNLDLRGAFCLPRVGNVLNLLLLPLASTLAKRVYLLGFDGRAPTDKHFWKYSDRHTYNEHFTALQRAHPAFFSVNDYRDYQRLYMDEEAERLFSEGERVGIQYIPMTPSFSEALARRWRAGWFTERSVDEQSRLREWEKVFETVGHYSA